MKCFKSLLLVTGLFGFGCATDNDTDANVVLIDQAKMMDMEETDNTDTEAAMVCEECPVCDDDTPAEIVDEAPSRSLNLYQSADNLYAWRKTRASLDPNADVVFYWSGYIYNVMPKDPADYPQRGRIDFGRPLFQFEGFNVARFAQDGPSDYFMLSREVSVYKDPTTGRVLNCWTNPLKVDRPEQRVMHVANDPVNYGVGETDFVELGDRISFFSDIILSYRSPLAGVAEYEAFSAGDVYQTSELFNYIVARKDLEDERVLSAPVEISWTRVGQYLPWMQMGDTRGYLVYHVRGYKVLGGVDELPGPLLEWTRNVAGEKFLKSPSFIPASYEPNETTWRVFRNALESGDYTPECE